MDHDEKPLEFIIVFTFIFLYKDEYVIYVCVDGVDIVPSLHFLPNVLGSQDIMQWVYLTWSQL